MTSVFWIKVTVFITFGTILSIIDLRNFRLPHRLTLPMAGSGFLFSFVPGNGLSPWESFLGFTVGIVPLGILAYRRFASFGFGDAVFAGAIGAFSGVLGLGIALFLGGTIALIVSTLQENRGLVAFGPWLAASGIPGLFLSNIVQSGELFH
jgi:leader peptidase (prepilin peptidase)/N-methyltransferase